jgi:hypothetical protein
MPIMVIDEKDGKIENEVMNGIRGIISLEEMNKVKEFFFNPDKTKVFSYELFGDRIKNDKELRDLLFETLASLNKKSYKNTYARFKKVTGISFRLPSTDRSEYVRIDINFKGEMYLVNAEIMFHNRAEWKFSIRKIRSEIRELLTKYLDGDKYELDDFFYDSELIFDEKYEDVIFLNKEQKGFVIKDARQFVNKNRLFGMGIEYCEMFERNRINRNLLIGYIKKEGINFEMVNYQFSRNDIVKYIIPSFKKNKFPNSNRMRAWFNMNIKDSEKVSIAVALMEKQDAINDKVIEIMLSELGHIKGLKEKMMKSQVIKSKIKKNSRIQLLLIL